MAANAFTLFGEIKVDTSDVSAKLKRTNDALKETTANLGKAEKKAKATGSALKTAFAGTLGALGVERLASAATMFVKESTNMYGSLDKLTRFTATLDKKFQTPAALREMQTAFTQLSMQIPHSAEEIAKASFTLKSAFSSLNQTDLVAMLKEFGNAATASNTDIASHVQNVAALAKQYGITTENVRHFSALIASSFGQALASDEKVAGGFNKILNAAKSTKQSLEDVVAAMSTLQSASSDAEQNTQLLQNVLSKFTDPKYVEGFKSIGVEVFDAAGNWRQLNAVINDSAEAVKGLNDQDIAKKFEFMRDQQARDGFLTLIRLVKEYNQQLSEGGDPEAFKAKNDLMLNSAEAKWKRLGNVVDSVKLGIGEAIVDFATIDWGAAVKQGLEREKDPARQQGFSIGAAIGIGMGMGIASMVDYVASHARSLAATAIASASTTLMVHSPSKVFFRIGQDVAQGFIDGIESLKTGVFAAMAGLFDITAIKGLAKKDAPGVELITELIRELDQLVPRTKLEAVMAELTAGKYKNLNAELRQRIVLLAKQLDLLEQQKKYVESIRERFGGSMNDDSVGDGSGRTDSGVMEFLVPPALVVDANPFQKLMDMLNPMPVLKPAWDGFWATMQQRLEYFKSTLPSLKQALGENLVNTLYQIGDVFAQAVMQWDGTAKGFFKSLAQGFRQLISQLISELIRLMVMKAVLQLIGAIAGGASNPATNGAGLGAGFSNPTLSGGGGFFGGAASGIGGVAANIAGGFAAPAMAMAGGGSVANSTFNNSVTVNLAGGGGTAQTAEQVARVVMLKLSQMQNRNK